MNKNYQYFIYLTDHAHTKPLIYKEYQLNSSEMIYKTIQEPACLHLFILQRMSRISCTSERPLKEKKTWRMRSNCAEKT